MGAENTDDERGIVDYGPLAGRLGTAAAILAALAFVGVVVEGVRSGLTFALMFRWAALFVVAFLLVAAVQTAGHALGGAGRAQRRGERLSGPGVGLVPPRRPRDEQ